MNKRIDIIDALKGFAILLVVLGHAIQYKYTATAFDENVVFRVIYSFHMPMFMFLSGLVAYYSFEMPVYPYLKKKFMALAVPFLAWFALAYFATGTYHTIALKSYIWRMLLSPDYGLWFLWVLFLNFCFLVVTVRMEKGLGLLAYPMMILFVLWTPFGFLGLGLAKVHFVYFTIGYLVMKYKEQLKEYFVWAQMLAMLAFPILVSQWHRTRGFSFLPGMMGWFASHRIPFVASLLAYAFPILLALSGIMVSYILVHYIIKNSLFYSSLCKLGNYTLDIYVSHQYFLWGIGLGVTHVFTAAGEALLISLLLSYFILRRIKILNLLFLGNRAKAMA